MMRHSTHRCRQSAFTLIEVMIVIALVAIVVSLAGPSFREYILMQRLRAIQSQLVTDYNFARSEAVSRGVPVQFRFQSGSGLSCYVIYSRNGNDIATTSPCDCTLAAGSRCPTSSSEIKTIVAPSSEGVEFWLSSAQALMPFLTFSPRTGAPAGVVTPEISNESVFDVEARLTDASRRFRTGISAAGRVSVCTPNATVAGTPSC